MASDPALIQATAELVSLSFGLLTAIVLWTLPHRVAKILAASQTAGVALGLLGRTSLVAGADQAWGNTLALWALVGGLVFGLVAYLYPERPGRIERAVIVAYVVWIVFIHILNRYAFAWIATPPPGIDFRITAKWLWLSPFGYPAGLLQFIVSILWLRRALRHEGEERRAAAFWVTVATTSVPIGVAYFLYMSSNVIRTGAWSYHEWHASWAPVDGDPWGFTRLLWFATHGAGLAFVAYATWRRQFAPILVLALVGGAMLLLRERASDVYVFVGAIQAFLFVLAVTRYNVFGARPLSRWAGVVLAAAFALPIFFATLTAALSLGDDGILLGAGIALGLALAVSAAVFVLRKVGGMVPFAADPTTTRSRIEPYHAVLLQELAAGTAPSTVFEKLRPLRARLGVSDHEHASSNTRPAVAPPKASRKALSSPGRCSSPATASCGPSRKAGWA